jgi:hypothetical protein
VFNDLSSQLDAQLQEMRSALLLLPPINASLSAAGLPPIVPSTEEIKSPATAASPGVQDGDEVDK